MENRYSIGEQILQKIDRLLTLVENGKEQEQSKEGWLNGEEVCRVLGVCKRTLQNYRDTGKIEFSQFGRKILYKRQSVLKFLNSYNNPDFAHKLKNIS